MDHEDQDDRFEPFPEPPDSERVAELRARIAAERGATKKRSPVTEKFASSARDLGAYTLIPALMIAGPLVGYLLGRGVEKLWGGEPWGAVGGMLLGVVAGFRETFLLLSRRSKQSRKP